MTVNDGWRTSCAQSVLICFKAQFRHFLRVCRKKRLAGLRNDIRTWHFPNHPYLRWENQLIFGLMNNGIHLRHQSHFTMRPLLLWAATQRWLVVVCRCFVTCYRSSSPVFSTVWHLKIGSIGCTETSINNREPTGHNNAKRAKTSTTQRWKWEVLQNLRHVSRMDYGHHI